MMNYLRNGDDIYRQSFAIIGAEAPLDGLAADLAQVAVRLIHACGMTDIVHDLEASPDAVQAGRAALHTGAPVLCDTPMVADGVIRSRLPAANPVLCTLRHPDALALASRLGNTRTAAAVELRRPSLAANSRGVPFLTLHGRRGGSAIAAAAVNALARQES